MIFKVGRIGDVGILECPGISLLICIMVRFAIFT